MYECISTGKVFIAGWRRLLFPKLCLITGWSKRDPPVVVIYSVVLCHFVLAIYLIAFRNMASRLRHQREGMSNLGNFGVLPCWLRYGCNRKCCYADSSRHTEIKCSIQIKYHYKKKYTDISIFPLATYLQLFPNWVPPQNRQLSQLACL